MRQSTLVEVNAELNALDWDPPLRRGGAMFSVNGHYRYRLWRILGPGRTVAFVMLNPSTANADVDDPTIRKCVGFARRLGFGRVEVVNLFAWRATEPRELLKVADPVGVENDEMIRDRAMGADLVIAAWGATDFPNQMVWRRQREVCQLLTGIGVSLQCLGVSKEGRPRHPLMLAYTTPLQTMERTSL